LGEKVRMRGLFCFSEGKKIPQLALAKASGKNQADAGAIKLYPLTPSLSLKGEGALGFEALADKAGEISFS